MECGGKRATASTTPLSDCFAGGEGDVSRCPIKNRRSGFARNPPCASSQTFPFRKRRCARGLTRHSKIAPLAKASARNTPPHPDDPSHVRICVAPIPWVWTRKAVSIPQCQNRRMRNVCPRAKSGLWSSATKSSMSTEQSASRRKNRPNALASRKAKAEAPESPHSPLSRAPVHRSIKRGGTPRTHQNCQESPTAVVAA